MLFGGYWDVVCFDLCDVGFGCVLGGFFGCALFVVVAVFEELVEKVYGLVYELFERLVR